MSRSPLTDIVMLSPNFTPMTDKKITKITIHHVAGVADAGSIANIFQSKSRQASCQYALGNDCKIALVVEEYNRAWTSSSSWNDSQAITIEVSNSATGGDWPVADSVFEKLLDWCVDVCQRNGLTELVYTGDKNGSLTEHRMFAATECPGTYLHSKMPYIAEEVTRRLKGEDNMTGEEIWNELNKYLDSQDIEKWTGKDALLEFEASIKAGITSGVDAMHLIPRHQAAIMAFRALPAAEQQKYLNEVKAE